MTDRRRLSSRREDRVPGAGRPDLDQPADHRGGQPDLPGGVPIGTHKRLLLLSVTEGPIRQALVMVRQAYVAVINRPTSLRRWR